MSNGAEGLRFPIRDENLETIGRLRAFDSPLLCDDDLIATMARHRMLYRVFFLTQFEATPDNKKRWLQRSVLENERKILFLLESLDGRIVGQDGLTLTGDAVFTLDGSMRWERGGHPRLFARSACERAALGFFLLGCERCELRIFKKNAYVTDDVSSIGWRVEREIPLSVSKKDGIIVYTETDEIQANTDEKLVLFSMTKSDFQRLHGPIVEEPCWKGVL